MGSFMANESNVTSQWLVVDGTDQSLGRLATRIATVLMGKHKPTYTPHCAMGDNVIVINADKVRVSSGNKPRTRIITYHTGWLGGLKQTPMTEVFERRPDKVVNLAVRRMLPKNKLARRLLANLRVYAGPEHPHVAQQPQPFPEYL